MKHRSTTVLALALAALLAGCKSDSGLKDAPGVKFFGVATARIEYDITVAGRVMGHATKIAANYGMYTSDHIVINGDGGEGGPQDQLVIQDDTVRYTIDLAAKRGMSSTADLQALLATARQLPNPSGMPVAELMELHNGAVRAGSETVAGRECAVYELAGGVKAAFWKGLLLKWEASMGAMKHVMTARTVETDVAVSRADFQVPEDVTITAGQPGLPANHPQVP